MSENSPSCIRFGVSHRCPDAIYTEFSGGVINGTQNRYDEHFGFDKMGNTTSFSRNGLLSSSGGYGTIDNLSFTYNGNQKLKITDSGTNGIFYGDEEFVRNTTNSGNSCAYDANGNRLYDSNSNVWGIRYNTLNLPDAMQFYQGHQTNYTYSASGAKLKVIDKTAPEGVFLPVTSLNTIVSNPSVSTITTTDYVGNMIYENGTLKRILTPVGYWQDGTYYYFLKDHLGSNRVVMTGSGGIAETSSYYPSGMRFGESAVNGGNVQPYRHTGHEMQEMHGLNWIDNLARFRTVSDGNGFTGVDPLCEKYYSVSPYVYCGGNPVSYVDHDGRKRLKFSWSFSLSSGYVGAAAKLFGFGAGFVSAPWGGVKQEISIYLCWDTDKKKAGVGVSHTSTDSKISNEGNLIVNGSYSKEKKTTMDANTIDGPSTKKDASYVEKETAGVGPIKDVSNNENKTTVEASTSLSANALMVGVEVKQSFTIEPEPKSEKEPQVQPVLKQDKK